MKNPITKKHFPTHKFATQEPIDGKIDENKYFELIHTGMNTDPRYGDFSFTEQELQEMADNFNNNVRGVEIAVDINHDPEKKAVAWIKPGSMVVKDSENLTGQKSLYAQLYKYTTAGKTMVKEGEYRYFSLEIAFDYETFKDKVKKFFKNVIVGLALTNSPVIKELAPTYAEQLTTNYSESMEMFNIFLQVLLSKQGVSVEEKDALQEMANLLDEDARRVAQPNIDAVLSKPEVPAMQVDGADQNQNSETPAQPTQNSEQTTDGDAKAAAASDQVTGQEPVTPPVTPEAKPADEVNEGEAEKGGEEKKELSEVKSLADATLRLAALTKERDALLTEKRKAVLSDRAKGMLLSKERKGSGFVKEKQGELESFLATLSEEQINTFDKLVGEVKSVDFSERGSSGAAEASSKDVHVIAEQIAKTEGITYSEALGKAYRQTGNWKSDSTI